MFDKVASFTNLYRSYIQARRCKRYRPEMLRFGLRLEENLFDIRKELLNKTYQHGGYREFVVSDSKKRVIRAAPFRDRIVHHAVCNVIEPIFEKSFIYDSYACRVKKGPHKAVKRLEKFLRSIYSRENKNYALCGARPVIYSLKCDISRYFDSIDHKILFDILKKKVRDADILWLLNVIIGSHSPGIPIGNLTSQLFANIYLNELDNFVKRTLRERYYIRYMDDFIVLSADKKHLHRAKELIRIFLHDELGLNLHPKKAEIFPTDKGIDFLGYVIKSGYRLLRKSTVKRFAKRLRYYKNCLNAGEMSPKLLQSALCSWVGYAKFGKSYRLRGKLCGEFVQSLSPPLKGHIPHFGGCC